MYWRQQLQAKWISLKHTKPQMPIFHLTVSAKHPHFPSTVYAKRRTCMFSHTGREIAWLASFLSDLAIIDHPISPPSSLPLSLGLPDLLIADWGRQAVQEPFNLALNREKAGNVFSSLRFMSHEQYITGHVDIGLTDAGLRPRLKKNAFQ